MKINFNDINHECTACISIEGCKNCCRCCGCIKNTYKCNNNSDPLVKLPVNQQEYKILSHVIAQKLSDQVNDHISKGWFPVGSLIYAGNHFYQAIMTNTMN